ncbi:MAG TPA: hypothetical protein VGH20_17810 [Myxococcales bacterium]
MPPRLRSVAFATLAVLAAVYCVAAALLYVLQARLIFVPEKLPKSAVFQFDAPFEERWIGYTRSDLTPGYSRSDSTPGELDSLFFPVKDARGTSICTATAAASRLGATPATVSRARPA